MYFFPHVCCICDSTNCNFKNVKRKDGELTIIEKLEYCVPEVVALKSPCSEDICSKCLENLNIVHHFKIICLKTHKKLYDYAKKLDANEQENSKLNVEVELSVKSEPLQTPSPDEELVAVYRVEVIKELVETEGCTEDTTYENNLRDDLSQIAENITSYPNSECLSESNSMAPDISVFDFDSELLEIEDLFFGFSTKDIETSSVISQKTIKNITVLDQVENDDDNCTCNICGITYRSTAHRKEHEITHEDKKPNICLICMKILGPHIQLKDHLQSHFKNSKDKTCNICNEKFPTANKLYYHKMYSHDHSSYTCQICSKRCTSKLSLTTHINTHFRSEKTLVTCPKCNKKFISQQNYHRHCQLVHEQIKPFNCHLCGRGFGLKHYLKRHLDTHTGLKRYQCHLCQKYFRYEESLTYHLKVHNKYKCPLCEETFMTFKLMGDHERQHRSDLPYHCNFCSKNFKLSSHLSNHISHKHRKELSTFFSKSSSI